MGATIFLVAIIKRIFIFANKKDMEAHKNVYLICNKYLGLTKIGISHNPKKRLVALETCAGVDLELFYHTLPCENSEIIEKEMHRIFKKDKANGEWFYTDKHILKQQLDSMELIIPRFVSLYIEGVSINKIAERYEVSRQYIQKLLKQSCVIDKKEVPNKFITSKLHRTLKDDIDIDIADKKINSSIPKESLLEMVRLNELKIKNKRMKSAI